MSIVIPTRDGLNLLQPCIDSIADITAYPLDRVEIIVVDNGSEAPETLDYLAAKQDLGTIRVLRLDCEFNFSHLNNEAVRIATGQIVVCLNNDTIITDPHWLGRLVEHARQDDVGIVGAKLLYEDRTLQHGGVLIGVQGLAIHAFRDIGEFEPGYLGLANRDHEITVVTGACFALRRSLFEQIGGFDEELAVAFNDVALCLAAHEAGFRNVYIGAPILIHMESKSRGFDLTREKQAAARRESHYARRKFNHLFRADPFYNPNLCHNQQYDLALPPRSTKPWQRRRLALSGKRRVLILTPRLWGNSAQRQLALVQADALAAAGHEVVLGVQHRLSLLFARPRHRLVRLGGVRKVAEFAWAEDMDCLITHDLPFHSAARHLAADARIIAIDHYGYFAERPEFHANDSHHTNELRFCHAMADMVLDAESPQAGAGIAAALDSMTLL